METMELTLAERGQIVIPKEARDALGLKAGARLQLRIEGGRLLIEKKVQLDLSRWIGSALDDGLSTSQALAELRHRAVPWLAKGVGEGIDGGVGESASAAKVAAPVGRKRRASPVKAKR
jgi:AbrB family looped-hinge helix DNA binding protein